MTAIWNIWSEVPRAFTPTGWKAKRVLGPTSNFDRKYLCNGTWYQQSERNSSIYSDSPICPHNLVNSGPQTAENGWQGFPTPKVCAQDELQAHIWDTFRFNHIRQMAPTGRRRCQELDQLARLRAGRAHAGLCRASSLMFYLWSAHFRCKTS